MPLELSAYQEKQLREFELLLRDRAVQLGLVAESDADRLGERHVRDSLRAANLILQADGLAVDIGSGAGLPGIVLAIARPGLSVVLVEPKTRALGFLELAVDRLRLGNVEIREARVEDVDLQADVAATRAFASLERSWQAAVPILRPGGRLIYFAGEGLEDPEGTAEAITEPEPPDLVLVERVVAGSSPLVIMTRQG
ncbi:MAG: 16S rRNA (guanine(527)-N(7))-methyltransferase RsmG [Actinomycetota bacterium]